jgi:hypothetical protein
MGHIVKVLGYLLIRAVLLLLIMYALARLIRFLFLA